MNLILKTILLSSATILNFAGNVTAQEKAEKKTEKKVAQKRLDVGSDAPALDGITWVQGDAVKSLNEKDKLYIVECWATWCGPCIAIIPHMNELHTKYADKGLVIIGMNVFEDGIEKSQEFVEKQGDAMSYRVAYSGGNASAFSKDWLAASGTRGIPTAFCVKDGKIIFNGHPAMLKDDTIEKMMKPDFDALAFTKELEETLIQTEALYKKIQDLYKANDWEGVKKIARTDALIKDKPDAANILSQANMQLDDWDAQSALLKEISAGKFGSDTKATQILGYIFASAAANDKTKALAAELEPLYAKENTPEDRNYSGRVAYARVLFFTGKNDESIKTLEALKTSLEAMKIQRDVAEFIAKIDASIASIKEGKFPPF